MEDNTRILGFVIPLSFVIFLIFAIVTDNLRGRVSKLERVQKAKEKD